MANKKIDIYMPLLIGDWLKGTKGMKAEVRGVYINLLLYQWDNGFIPSDMEDLRLIDSEIDKVWVSLKSKFEEFEPGRLRNKKNDEVKNFFTKQRENGKNGGRPPIKKPKAYPKSIKIDNPKDNLHNMNYEFEYEFNSEDENFEKSEKLFEKENFKKQENEEKFLVPEMLKVFKNHLKTYQGDVSKDFKPLQLIAQFICNAQGIPYYPREPDHTKIIIENWRIISEFIAQDNFFKNWNLITIEKHIQTICQSIINHESGNSKKGKTGSGKISGERLNKAFAEFYSIG